MPDKQLSQYGQKQNLKKSVSLSFPNSVKELEPYALNTLNALKMPISLISTANIIFQGYNSIN